jgi:mono/diheme cytochrome c family protein
VLRTIRFHLDENCDPRIAAGLKLHGVDEPEADIIECAYLIWLWSLPQMRVRFFSEIVLLAAVTSAVGAVQVQADDLYNGNHGPPVEFNREIRPILSDNCYQCHGPDKVQRQAELRLDTEAGANLDLGGRRAIVPGDVGQSEMFQRLATADDSERMPPVKTGKRLTPAQIETVRRWIMQGARWQKHWAFIPPVAAPLPAVARQQRVRNAIDAFVLARLEKEGLSLSVEADRTTLIRRVSFDLTGLPPTPDEVDAFLSDRSEGAYESVVDRLLASSRFGERMAVRWLDGARYADTNGYQSDGERSMWRWRDWVIDAYNRNMPFDQFTVEQIAGDMLPHATLDQQIASAFNRNHRGNAEGGIIPEEYAAEYVVDRVDTTSTVWLGLTMGCSRCHDHKFDAFTQKEFYQLFAYFNNVPEFGRAIKYGNSPPFIKTPTAEQQDRLKALDRKLAEAEAAFNNLLPELAAVQGAWERSLDAGGLDGWTVTRGQIAHFPIESVPSGSSGDAAFVHWENGEASPKPGKIGQAGEFDGQRFINAGNVAPFGFLDKFSLAAWVNPEPDRGGTIISRMTDAEHADGYYVVLEQGRVQVNLVKRWLDDALRVETEVSLAPRMWQHVLVTYDGSRLASGVQVFVDGKPQKLRVVLDLLNQTFATKEPLRIGGGNGSAGRFHGLIDDVRIYDDALTETDAQILAMAEPVGKLKAVPVERRTIDQTRKLQACFLERAAPSPIREAHNRVESLRKDRPKLIESFPTTMVMQEMPVPRQAFVLIRGEYDKPGEKVGPGIPSSFGSLPAGAPHNRLGLARWIADRSNPLTARVAVNRMWQMLFGTGLVKTVDDFGSQGEWPSHPELLDWLAVEFMADHSPAPLRNRGDGGGKQYAVEGQEPGSATPPNPPLLRGGGKENWDVKALLRLIVTSSTYRQSSRLIPAVQQRDPDNRWLARGTRTRLSAEMVRDQALYAGGLLVEKLGGHSVKPYQPAGLWKELADTEYVQDTGENLYRRSMYTYFKRTVAPPTMMTFDAAGRETCVVRETRTNTPLQALTLMNEVTFIEAARGLAQRIMVHNGSTPAERLTLAFRLATSRPPRPRELEILLAGWQSHCDRFAKSPDAADKLTKIGELPRPANLDVIELAAYTTVAGLLLNLDETITKE